MVNCLQCQVVSSSVGVNIIDDLCDRDDDNK